MGNRESTQYISRRSDFRPSDIFPEPSWERYDDWEIYHIDIELKILPPHLRHKIHVCVDEYTQEIIHSEENCTQVTDPSLEDERGFLHLDDRNRSCFHDKGHNARYEFCPHDNNALDGLCHLNDVTSEGLCFHNDVTPLSEGLCLYNGDVTDSLCLNDHSALQELQLQDDGDSSGLCSQRNPSVEQTGLQDDGMLELRSQGNSFSNRRCSQSYDPLTEMCLKLHADKTRQQDHDGVRLQSPVLREKTRRGNEDVFSVNKSSSYCQQHDEGLPNGRRQKSHSSPLHGNRELPPLRSNTILDQHQESDHGHISCSSVDLVRDVSNRRRSDSCRSAHRNVLPTRTRPLNDKVTPILSQASCFSDDLPSSGGNISKSVPIPIPTAHSVVTALKSADRRKRRFSLKEEPGWIPNPLDSDSDSSDFEDSGVFTDATGSSPRISTSPPGHFPSSQLAHKRITQLSQRRRYNSEPTPLTWTSPVNVTQTRKDLPSPCNTRSDSTSEVNVTQTRKDLPSPCNTRSDSTSDDTPQYNKSGSKWKLVKYALRRNKTETVDHLAVPDTYCKAEEEELKEQLEWLACMPDSQPSEKNECSSENSEVEPSLAETSESVATGSQQAAISDCFERGLSPCPTEQRPRRRPEPELELDWLCEPEWNNLELELFWTVLRPHLEQLLQHVQSDPLPEPCVTVCSMDAADHKMLDRCLLHVQWHIWKGSYRQAVADFRAVRCHFRCCAESYLIESGTRDDMESLRLIFQRKRPSRFRLWI